MVQQKLASLNPMLAQHLSADYHTTLLQSKTCPSKLTYEIGVNGQYYAREYATNTSLTVDRCI